MNPTWWVEILNEQASSNTHLYCMCSLRTFTITNLKGTSLIYFLAPAVIEFRGIIIQIGRTTVCILFHQKLLGFHCYTPSSIETGCLGGINNKIIYEALCWFAGRTAAIILSLDRNNCCWTGDKTGSNATQNWFRTLNITICSQWDITPSHSSKWLVQML